MRIRRHSIRIFRRRKTPNLIDIGRRNECDIESFLPTVFHLLREPSVLDLSFDVAVGNLRGEFLECGKLHSGTVIMVTTDRFNREDVTQAGPLFINTASAVEQSLVAG